MPSNEANERNRFILVSRSIYPYEFFVFVDDNILCKGLPTSSLKFYHLWTVFPKKMKLDDMGAIISPS